MAIDAQKYSEIKINRLEELSPLSPNASILLIGNIGSGKSTIDEPLSKISDFYNIASDELFLTLPEIQRINYLKSLDLINTKKYTDADDLAKNQQIIFDFEISLFSKRVNLLREQIEKAKLENKTPLIDFGLVGSWTYLRSHFNNGRITENQWNKFDFNFKRITENSFLNTTLVYLQVPPEICRQRVENRAGIDSSRTFELEAYTLEGYIKPMHIALEEFIIMYGRDFSKQITFKNFGNQDLRKTEDQNNLFLQLSSRRDR